MSRRPPRSPLFPSPPLSRSVLRGVRPRRPKTADAGEHLGPQRAPGERLDRLDQRVAGLDVDAGVAVGKSFRHARVQILLDMPALASPQLWAWITIALAAGFLAWVLSPILAPFLFAAILAYIFDPLVERLTRHRVPRTLAVVLVLLLAVAAAVAIMLVVLPLFYKETRLLIEKLPGFVAWFNTHAAPWLKARLDLDAQLDVENATQLGKQMLAENEQLAKHLLTSLKTGGMVLITILADLVLVPVVLFYLLRDWNLLLDRVDVLIPRRVHAKARAMAAEVDAVLAQWLRGQVLVIAIMSVYYVLALWLARLEFALPIGILSGPAVIVSFG